MADLLSKNAEHLAVQLVSNDNDPVENQMYFQNIKMPAGRRERELLQKQMSLRAKLPVLTTKETTNFGKSFKHSLCTELLSAGFHLSFDEIFNLIQEQKQHISQNGKKVKLLEEEKGKLNIIKKQLMEAESAVIAGEYLMAMEKLEWFYDLTAGREWTNDEGVNLHQQASSYLYQIYTFMAMKMKESSQAGKALFYLQKAHERAFEAKDEHDIGEAIYKLGIAYLDAKDPDVAIEHLKDFMAISKNLNNADGMGRAANGIASAYEIKGDTDTCMSYLRMYVDIAEKNGLEQAYSIACHHLGSICYLLAMHEEAVEWFSKAYNISRALNDLQSLGANRVQFGAALAHKMNVLYIKNVQMPNTQGLLKWKSFRTEEFISDEKAEKGGKAKIIPPIQKTEEMKMERKEPSESIQKEKEETDKNADNEEEMGKSNK